MYLDKHLLDKEESGRGAKHDGSTDPVDSLGSAAAVVVVSMGKDANA